jgi:hypothetical protein
VTYRIQDWTGRVLFDGKEFASFEEGWEHIYENDPEPEGSDHHYDDYSVDEVPADRTEPLVIFSIPSWKRDTDDVHAADFEGTGGVSNEATHAADFEAN